MFSLHRSYTFLLKANQTGINCTLSLPLSLKSTQFCIYSWHWVNTDQSNGVGFAKTHRGFIRQVGHTSLGIVWTHSELFRGFLVKNPLVHLLCQKGHFHSYTTSLNKKQTNKKEMSFCRPSQTSGTSPSVYEVLEGGVKEPCPTHEDTAQQSPHALTEFRLGKSHCVFREESSFAFCILIPGY